MRTFTRQLPFSIYLLIFILLQFVLVVLLSYGKQQVSDSYQQQFSLELENDFAFTLSHYRDLSNFLSDSDQSAINSITYGAGW